MAFCGQCGQKNPDGAKFCSACGSPLATSVDATDSRSQETPSKSERIILHRESAPPPPPRRDSTSQSRRETGNLWQDMNRNRDRQSRQEEPSRPQRGFEKPAKKGGKLGSCLMKLILWFFGISALICLLVWAISAFMNDSGGSDGGDEDQASSGLLSKDYERIFDDARFEKLRNRHEFPLSTVDVSVQPGVYTTQLEKDGVKGDITLKIEPTESDNKKILGRAEFAARVEGKGEGSQTLTVTYAGNSVYVLYPSEEEIGSLDGMVLFVSPDGKTLDCYERGDIIMSFKMK